MRSLRLLTVFFFFTGCTHYRETAPILAAARVGPEGGHLEGEGFALDIPAGALSDGRDIVVRGAMEPVAGFEPVTPVFQFEPSGTTFAMPVHVAFDVPADRPTVMLWSRAGDAQGYDFVAFSDHGRLDGSITHFSTGFGTEANTCSADPTPGEAPPPPAPDPECPDENPPCAGGCATACGTVACDDVPQQTCDQDPCRSMCLCRDDGNTDRGTNQLCMVDPGAGMGPGRWQCPDLNPQVTEPIQLYADSPRRLTGYETLSERTGAPCYGYRPVYANVCDCLGNTPTATNTQLCAAPMEPVVGGAWVTPAMSSNWECHSTLIAPRTGMRPTAPLSPNDYTWKAYRGMEGDLCLGHYVNSSASDYRMWSDVGGVTGRMGNCDPHVLIGWEQVSGSASDCNFFSVPSSSTSLVQSSADRTRCRMTADEWNHLQTRRADCGLPPRMPFNPMTGRNWDPRVLAILSTPELGEVTGLNGRRLLEPDGTYTGSSQWQRAQAVASGTCDAPLPREYLPPGGDTAVRYRGAGPSQCHAEGDALEQLAASRNRAPADLVPGDDYDQVDLAQGGTTGGSAEMLVDMDPCSSSCAVRGLDRLRREAGLDELIVRAPGGSARYCNTCGLTGETLLP